jgi:hypothetical protein
VPVSQPGEAAEREADALADRLAPFTAAPQEPHRSPLAFAPRGVWDAVASPGRALPSTPAARALGIDPSSVRLHTGDLADESTRAIGAAAYTVGDDVVLGAGFEPGSDEGLRLIAHELVHVAQQRRHRHGAVVHRQGIARTPVRREPKVTVDKVAAKVDQVWADLLALAKREAHGLDSANKRIRYYLERYDRAYDSFTDWLKNAKEESEAFDKWKDVMADIVVGAALGTGAGELFEAATLAGKIVEEVVVHSVEAGAVAGGERVFESLGTPKPDFTPPPEVSADKVARGYLDKLSDAWRAFALLESGALELSPTRDALRDAAGARGRGASPKPKLNVEGLTATMKSLDKLSRAIADTDRKLAQFLTRVDTPLLGRSQTEIEQDLFIKWMALSSANAEAFYASKLATGLEMWKRLSPFIDYREELHWGVHPRMYAQLEAARIQHIGEIGVVVLPPRTRVYPPYEPGFRPGIVHLRPDLSALQNVTDDESRYVEIAYSERTYLRPGEVVVMQTTSPRGLVPKRLDRSVSVSQGERSIALRKVGLKEGQFEPEAVEALLGPVERAITGYVLRAEYESKGSPTIEGGRRWTPRVATQETDDGVLVIDQLYRQKIVLFTPRTDDTVRNAAAQRARTGVPRIVAIELDPAERDHFQEIRTFSLVVTGHADLQFIADEIVKSLVQGPD